MQLAEVIRQEVSDLQDAGIPIIQIDEAAFREGLSLHKADQAEYWDWAVNSFKHCASSANIEIKAALTEMVALAKIVRAQLMA